MPKNMDQIAPKTPEKLPDYKARAETKKRNFLKSLSSEGFNGEKEQQEKVENLTEEIKSIYPPEKVEEKKPFSANRLTANTKEANRPSAIYPKKPSFFKKIGTGISEFLSRNKRKMMLTGVATGISIASMAGGKMTEGDPTDSLKKADIKKMESVINKTKDKVEIKIANYFQTDKAEISKENSSEISKLIATYINSLNKDNVNQFLNSSPTINVSSDPRPTNSFPDGNSGLSLARAKETQRSINSFLDSLDFSKTNLSPEDIKKVKEKLGAFKFNIPIGGVVDYHMVTNPNTNKNFTDGEWMELQKPENIDKLHEIFKSMRFVNMELVSLNKEVPPGTKPEIPETTFNFDNYSKAILLVDKSPSMEANKKLLIKHLLETSKKDIETSVIGFTSEIDTSFKSSDLAGAAKTIEDMQFINEDKELTLDASIAALTQAERSEKKGVMYIITDEELQEASLEKINKLDTIAQEKNYDLKFTILIRGHEYRLGIDQIRQAFIEKYATTGRAEDLKNNAKQIAVMKKILAEQEADLASPNHQGSTRSIKENIEETKDEIKGLEERQKWLTQVNIDNFSSVEGKKIQQIGKDYSNVPNTLNYSSGLNSTNN